jgi:hypothetical protein
MVTIPDEITIRIKKKISITIAHGGTTFCCGHLGIKNRLRTSGVKAYGRPYTKIPIISLSLRCARLMPEQKQEDTNKKFHRDYNLNW